MSDLFFSWRRSEHTDRNVELTKGSSQNPHYSKESISIHDVTANLVIYIPTIHSIKSYLIYVADLPAKAMADLIRFVQFVAL